MLGLSLITLCIYILGNAQGFTDRTLIILFNIEITILSLTAIIGALSALSCLTMLPFSNKLNVGTMCYSMLISAVSFSLFFGTVLLQAFLDGYAGI